LTAGVIAALIGGVGASAAGSGAERDPFFPKSGSSAYDVSHYDVSIKYTPPAGKGADGTIVAEADLHARSARALDRFSLDLVGLRVTNAKVDGFKARFEHRGGKLIVTPATPLASGANFTAAVFYRGAPGTITDPDDSEEGWFQTKSRGAVALGEPVGTATWIPCNNSLTDKATFEFHLNVPDGAGGKPMTAVANGRLVNHQPHGNRTDWNWAMRQPMAPYLATVAIDKFRLRRGRVDGIPSWTAVDADTYQSQRALVRRGIRALPEVIRFERGLYGPYPFDAVGTTIVDGGAYALETQSRPTYPSPPRRNLLVHELAHQWVGDSVSVRTWPDIWLNEGIATFTEWIYRERHGGPSVRAIFNELRRRPATDSFWTPPPGRPGDPKNLFDGSVYVRGAMTLEALRIKLGDSAFFRILRRWAIANRYGNVTTSQFIEFVEQHSGRPLGGLFDRWLYGRGKP
jgi:aminopeptidase N